MVDKTISKVYQIANALSKEQQRLREELGEINAPKLIDDSLYYAILEMKDAHLSQIGEVVMKPCSHCGSKNCEVQREITTAGSSWYVQCMDCKNHLTGYFIDGNAAVKAWNNK